MEGYKMKAFLLAALLLYPPGPVLSESKPVEMIEKVEEDNQAFDIQILKDGNPIEELTGYDATQVQVNKKNVDSEFVEIYFDQTLQNVQWESDSLDLQVPVGTKVLRVVVHNKQGDIQEKRVCFNWLKKPELKASVNDGDYILDETVHCHWEIEDPEAYDLVIEDQEGVHKTSVEKQAYDYLCQKTGKVSMYLQHREYPNLRSNSIHFTYTNEALQGHIEKTEDGRILGVADSSYVDSGSLTVEKEGLTYTSGLSEPILIPIEEQEECTIHAVLNITDLFGRHFQTEEMYRIDRKAPMLQLFVNGTQVNAAQISTSSLKTFSYQSDEPAQIDVMYLLNGLQIPVYSMKDVFESLKPQDVLTTVFTLKDEAGNVSTTTYEWIKPAILETKRKTNQEQFEKTALIQTFNASDQLVQYHVWSFDGENHLQFQQKKKALQSPKQNEIRIYVFNEKNHKKARILFKSNLEKLQYAWIEINGKKISKKQLKTDKLGNLYYETTLKNKRTTIHAQIHMKDGSVKRLNRTIIQKQAFVDDSMFSKIKHILTQILMQFNHD